MSLTPGSRSPATSLRTRQELLNRKREQQDIRQRAADRDNKFFKDWEAESSTRNNWNKVPKSQSHTTRPPYGCDERAFTSSEKQISPENLRRVSQEIRETLRSLNELERDAVETKETGCRIVSHVTSIRRRKLQVFELLQSLDQKMNRINQIRSARDRLLQHLFLIQNKIQVIQTTVDDCFKITESDLFCIEEKQDLQSVHKSTGNIVRVMVNLNNCRHENISVMYSEEAERCYNDLMSQWSEEDDMCQQILDKVFETIDAVLLEKLEANADLEQHILEQRKSLVETLYSLFSDLQTKPTVWKAIGADVLRLISSDRSSAPTADSLTPKIGSRY